jgi:hypothetical protein
MSRQLIIVGRELQALQNKIREGYGKGFNVKITGVIISVTEPKGSVRQAVLKAYDAKGEPETVR